MAVTGKAGYIGGNYVGQVNAQTGKALVNQFTTFDQNLCCCTCGPICNCCFTADSTITTTWESYAVLYPSSPIPCVGILYVRGQMYSGELTFISCLGGNESLWQATLSVQIASNVVLTDPPTWLPASDMIVTVIASCTDGQLYFRSETANGEGYAGCENRIAGDCCGVTATNDYPCSAPTYCLTEPGGLRAHIYQNITLTVNNNAGCVNSDGNCVNIAESDCSGDCPEDMMIKPIPKIVQPSIGVGDTIKKVLDATGIGTIAKKVIEKTTGKPCGCSDRQAALNKVLPYKTATKVP